MVLLYQVRRLVGCTSLLVHGVSMGEGKDISKRAAKGAAAEMTLAYLAENGIPAPLD